MHSRPILHSSHRTNVTLPYSGVQPPSSNNFHWGLFILMILMMLSFAVIMSKWGWNKITGQIWKLSSGWPWPVENMEDEEELLGSEEVAMLEMHEIKPLPRKAKDTVRQHEQALSRT